MTMQADIVTNDAGELVRREHARDLGAGVVVAIYRLTKLAMMHDLTNQAFMRQLDQAHELVHEYCLRAGTNVNVLFADRAVFVAGQLLKGSRGIYDAASELGEIFERFGGSELFIAREVTREDMLALAEQISICHRTGGRFELPNQRIRIREVSDAVRLRGIHLEDLTPEQRIVRAYATAVVIMRRFFEDLTEGRYILPRRIKRIAQSLVDLSRADTAAFLGVTEVRNANFDEAGRAANTAILAVSIAREITDDRGVLAQIAMAAMMHDVSRPRALALASARQEPALPGMQGPSTLSEDQEDRLASGAAAVLTALGRVNEPSITRTVLTFEALWLRRKTWIGPVYWGARAPTLHASMIAIARRYNDLLTPEPGMPPPTPDFAVAVLAGELEGTQDRSVLRMLVSALGLLPIGTVVQLSTGETAEVVRGARGLGDKPVVRLLSDPKGKEYSRPAEVDLGIDRSRAVSRVLSVDGWKKGLAERPASDIAGGYDPDAAEPAPAPEAAVSRDGSIGSGTSEKHVAESLLSMGSTPSAVAEAMGRMISDSVHPSAISPKGVDRTVFQPSGPDLGHDAAPREPTARGNLGATPLPHVLVYMLDHRLTGSVVFEGEGNDDTIYFIDGIPRKLRLAEPVAILGDVLVDAGALDKATIDRVAEDARRVPSLLGQHLLGKDLISSEMLEWVLESQLLQRVAHIANLSPEIEYAYYQDVDLLSGWSSPSPVTHPLNPVLSSVRSWNDRARIRATLGRIANLPLSLHPECDLSGMALMQEEQLVLDAIRGEKMSLSRLLERALADEELVSSLMYALAVTRQFSFHGQKKGPLGAGAAAVPSTAPAADPAPRKSSGSMPAAARRAAAPPEPVLRAAAPAPEPARQTAPKIRPVASKKQRTMIGVAPPAARAASAAGRIASPVAEDESEEKTIALDPSSRPPRAVDGGGALAGRADAERALEARQAFRVAEAALRDNDVVKAERLAAKALEADPTQPDCVVLLAWIRSLDNDPNRVASATGTMSKVLLEDPSNELALFYRGKLLVRANRLHDALNDFAELVSVNPDHRAAAGELASLKLRLGIS